MEKEIDKNKKSIKNIYIHVTKLCNLHCKYCYFNAGKAMKNELHSSELLSLFKEIVFIEPKKVIFTGGEPLLRKDIFCLVNNFHKMIDGKRINLCLISNGLLIDDKTALKIAELFDEVRISIDGPPEVNDILRGNGSFKNALNAINNLKNAGISPVASVTITSLNLPLMKDFLSFLLDELFITNIHLSILKPSGRNLDHPELKCSWEKVEQIISEFWQNRFIKSSLTENRKRPTLASCSSCGLGEYINILPDGAVYPCHVLSEPRFFLGNIREQKLSDIIYKSKTLVNLKNIDFKKLIKIDKNLKKLLQNATCMGEVYRDNPDFFKNMNFTQKLVQIRS